MTTVSSTTTSTAADAAAASKKTGASIIKTLGTGSGIDTQSLAQSLVDAERIPQEGAINAKISKNESRISGYAAIAYSAAELKSAFSALNDMSDFNSLAVRNSNSAAFEVTTSATAALGDYQIDVQTLARPQRTASDGFADTTTALSSTDLTLSLSINGAAATDIAVAAADSSPGSIVDAINNAELGVTAQLINTGDGSGVPFKILLTGTSGESKAFTITTSNFTAVGTASLDFNTDAPLQAATDATVVVNGLTIKRSTNVIADAVKGVTLNLFSKTTNPLDTSTTTPATVNLTRDTSSLKEKFITLVTNYNDANSMLNVLANKDSSVEIYGGALFGDSTVRTVRSMFRDIMIGASNTPGTNASYLWQLGISLTKEGPMELDETKLDAALNDNFDNVVKMVTGNTQSLSAFSSQSSGIAGEAIKKLTKLVSVDGLITKQTESTNTQIAKYELDLETLNDRMTKLLERYQKDFSVMDNMVGQSTSVRASLKSSFEGMANINKDNIVLFNNVLLPLHIFVNIFYTHPCKHITDNVKNNHFNSKGCNQFFDVAL